MGSSSEHDESLDRLTTNLQSLRLENNCSSTDANSVGSTSSSLVKVKSEPQPVLLPKSIKKKDSPQKESEILVNGRELMGFGEHMLRSRRWVYDNEKGYVSWCIATRSGVKKYKKESLEGYVDYALQVSGSAPKDEEIEQNQLLCDSKSDILDNFGKREGKTCGQLLIETAQALMKTAQTLIETAQTLHGVVPLTDPSRHVRKSRKRVAMEEEGEQLMRFGKYENATWREVFEGDPGYTTYCIEQKSQGPTCSGLAKFAKWAEQRFHSSVTAKEF